LRAVEKEMVIRYLGQRQIGSYWRNHTCAREEDKLIFIECKEQGWPEGKARRGPESGRLIHLTLVLALADPITVKAFYCVYTLGEDGRLLLW